MNTNQLSIFSVEPVTMTSLELVDFINSQRDSTKAQLRHDSFMDKVPNVFGEKAASIPIGTASYVVNNALRHRPIYTFHKREACLMAMSYSYDLQAKVYDRMTDMEEQAKFKLPDFTNPAIAARAWADMADKAQELFLENNSKQQQLDLAAPKVDFVDKYTDSDSLFGFRQVAKLLNIKEASLRAFLVRRKIMYNLSGTWMAYQPHIDNKYFSVKTGLYAANKSFATCMFTTKGLYYIHKLMSKESLEVNLALMD